MVVGAFQVAPDAMMVQIMNNDRVEMFIVPIDQYKRCDTEEKAVKIWQKFLNPYINAGARTLTPVPGSEMVRLDSQSNGAKAEKPAYHWFSQ